MKPYITQARAVALAKSIPYGDTNSPHTVLNPEGSQQLCEAAIKDFISNSQTILPESYWVDCMCAAMYETAKKAPEWKGWPGTAAFAKATYPVMEAYAAQAVARAAILSPTEDKAPPPPTKPEGLPPVHSYVVEGWEDGKLVATAHAYEVVDARATASKFAMHYSTVHTKRLHTAGAVTLWAQDQMAQVRHDMLKKP